MEWLGFLWHVYSLDVSLSFIQFMVVFSWVYFDRDWFLIHLQRGSKHGSLYKMRRATLGGSSEWIWLWPLSCECVHSWTLVTVGISTWLPGEGFFFPGACAPHAQRAQLLRRRREWGVSFEWGMEGDILSYFTSLEFQSHCEEGSRCMFWKKQFSLWHQWRCQFGILP